MSSTVRSLMPGSLLESRKALIINKIGKNGFEGGFLLFLIDTNDPRGTNRDIVI